MSKFDELCNKAALEIEGCYDNWIDVDHVTSLIQDAFAPMRDELLAAAWSGCSGSYSAYGTVINGEHVFADYCDECGACPEAGEDHKENCSIGGAEAILAKWGDEE